MAGTYSVTHVRNSEIKQLSPLFFAMLGDIDLIFSLTFRRKKVALLSSLWRQRLVWLSFLSESISQKLSKVSIWNYQKRNQLQQGRWHCDLYIQSYLPLLTQYTCRKYWPQSVDNSIQHFIWVIPPFWLSSKNTISQ